jgi:Tol biopolymer transport system component
MGAAAGVLAIALAAISWLHLRETPPEARVMRTFIPPPDKTVFSITASFNDSGPVALSPDGRRMVFSARSADGKNQLWIRPLDAITPQPLAGTEGATMPFWSPESRYVGFFSGGKLKKIDTSGGPPLTLCDASEGRGGTWNQDGVIVFAPDNAGPLRRVSAAGGVSMPVTSFDRTPGATSHRVPWFLPDGRHFFYLAAGGGSAAAIYVGSLDSRGDSKVIEALSNGIYSQGHLLFLREDTLMAQPFDLKRLNITGEAVPIAENVRSVGALRVGVFSASENGLLAYQAGGGLGGRILAWFDRSGKQIGTLGDSGGFITLHFSPDQKSVAVSLFDLSRRNNSDIWLYDVARGLRTRFTFDPDPNQEAIWSPDGSSIVFDSTRKGPADLYRKASSGEGTEELLYADKFGKHPKGWSPDGKFLLYSVASSKTGADIWILPLAGGERKPFPFGQTPFNETAGQFSPDGRWIAYQSDESQRTEIYVAPFNGPGGAPGGKRQISTDGGSLPRWRRDGKEIFYLSADGRLMAAEVNIKGASVEVGAVRPLFGLPVAITGAYRYDVSADGQRFLAITEREQTAAEPITLVQNWADVFKK